MFADLHLSWHSGITEKSHPCLKGLQHRHVTLWVHLISPSALLQLVREAGVVGGSGALEKCARGLARRPLRRPPETHENTLSSVVSQNLARRAAAEDGGKEK